jgi:hypothetical protein
VVILVLISHLLIWRVSQEHIRFKFKYSIDVYQDFKKSVYESTDHTASVYSIDSLN